MLAHHALPEPGALEVTLTTPQTVSLAHPNRAHMLKWAEITRGSTSSALPLIRVKTDWNIKQRIQAAALHGQGCLAIPGYA